DHLRIAGAEVDEVEAYRMTPRPAVDIALDWTAAAPDAAVIGSSRVAQELCAAVGAQALSALRAVVAIGRTTAGTLRGLGVTFTVADAADFASTVAVLTAARAAEHRT
ncbi:MAG: uroporphyrinogen-III synthase, partial [Acidobacteria bacterium]|nr:uroporphyrinogen-III synthase [Acidobacteriota bacterium]